MCILLIRSNIGDGIIYCMSLESTIILSNWCMIFTMDFQWMILGKLTVLWNVVERIIDLEDIAELINIPLKYRNNDQLQIVDYANIIGPNCEIPPDSGVKATATYRNVYSTCRWVCNNITGTSKSSSFYGSTLACVHALMTKDYDYCVVR